MLLRFSASWIFIRRCVEVHTPQVKRQNSSTAHIRLLRFYLTLWITGIIHQAWFPPSHVLLLPLLDDRRLDPRRLGLRNFSKEIEKEVPRIIFLRLFLPTPHYSEIKFDMIQRQPSGYRILFWHLRQHLSYTSHRQDQTDTHAYMASFCLVYYRCCIYRGNGGQMRWGSFA